MKRILTAAVGIPLALAAVYWLPGPLFFLATVILFSIGAWEYSRLAGLGPGPGITFPVLLLVPLIALLLCPALWSESGVESAAALTGAALFVLTAGGSIWAFSRRTAPDRALGVMGSICFGVPYLALPAAALFHLRSLSPHLLVLLFTTVWLGDAAAYYVGSAWGRRRLAPVVSPNKTWEGALASLGGAMFAAVSWGFWRSGELRWSLLVIAVVISISAQAGDLVESLLKRGAGVKDSGQIMPGHGGVLDRIDALLFAAPVLWIAVVLFGDQGWIS